MNKKIWNLYKQSSEYYKLVDVFNPDAEDIFASAYKVFRFCEEMGDDKTADELQANFCLIHDNFVLQGYEFTEEATRDGYEAFINELILFDAGIDNEQNIYLIEDRVVAGESDFRLKNCVIDALSVFLYYGNHFFKPVLFATKFNIIMQSCEELGIELPSMPKVRDYKAAMMWYYDICAAFNAFQKEYDMTDQEFCACLYGLGPSLEDDAVKRDMPKPVNVWLTGASKEDYKALEEDMHNDSLWACNENTRRGDIVVLYALSPHSCIHSIWRADSEGTFNPFDYYQCRTRVSNGVKISPIKLNELKADPEFGKLPMLNNNLQGINGKRLPSWAYSALLKMIEAKGDDMSSIPVLFESKDWNPGEITSEHDVEEKILIPALLGLGYKEGDWTRQLRLKAGRGEKAIPDFVFFPHGEEHAENAPLVIEAKWHMSSEKERNDNYRQGRSYAKMLESDIMGICDDERLILYKRNSNKEFNYASPVFEAVWAAIAGDEQVHDMLMQLIGAEVIKAKK